jgi:diguanylate cyclase (GGDEF)-like protein
MMDNESIGVLLIEDDADYAIALQDSLGAGDNTSGYGQAFILSWADRLAAGLKQLEHAQAEVIVLDLNLPDAQGLAGLRQVRAAHPETPVVVLTGTDEPDMAIGAVRAGAEDYLIKGQVTGPSLLRALRYALERSRLRSILRDLSLVDDLTGLYNRRGFYGLAEQRLALAKRTGASAFLVFVDVDKLKEINDRFGHTEGSFALCRVAEILRATFRQSDVVARIGGDEFTVFGTDTQPSRADSSIARLRSNLALYNREAKKEYELNVSLAASYCAAGENFSLEELIARADKGMYAEKQAKRRR